MSSQRIYTLGASPLMYFIAHELAHLPTQPAIPNIIVLLNDSAKLQRFLDGDSKITMRNDPRVQRQFMAAAEPPMYVSGKASAIENMIVVEQNKRSLLSNITRYTNSLTNQSNVLLVNPPMGSVESILETIWPQEMERPNLFMGLTERMQNAVVSRVPQKEFDFNLRSPHKRLKMFISPIPRGLYNYEESKKDLLKLEKETPLLCSLVDLPSFDISLLSYGDVMFLRLDTLIVETCIESLAALYDCKYRKELLLLEKPKILFKLLIKEQLRIIVNAYPFLKHLPNYPVVMDEHRLYHLVIEDLEESRKTQKSRMLANIRKLSTPNTDQLTGYFVKLAYATKTDCKWNKLVTWLLNGKAKLQKHRALDYHYL
ncbi:Cbs2p KNAG_0A04630 [Huiozyma naganishii CBS 8797]|uniref:Ketopantoate reductase C-terminal domain-containing protein n=1 Tax=Huiozyma naganishii (strain ATCC MYA-139 / BCRC 22969 / CBS 8797 / KCTC 17520 / NBRC 10181 / NCYC 3082 / Yp74L-3) TaxID=1071383 RepID=J7R013_HUIN7|nr:hypothetical protein KNAG_0A04630 [Kazachstania naganishii CBS 8797]CCK68135.1 hypothetical protein KNAG_0A04630 [Kazachstania naganishii CBS 8797]